MAHDGHDHDHEHPHQHHPEPEPVREHRASAPTSVSCFVLTCSDTRTEATDGGGPVARRLLEGAGHVVLGAQVVKDEREAILAAIDQALGQGARAVVLTGGTGLSRRDVTIEAVDSMVTKPIPGFGELFRQLSFAQIGSAAMLSRATAGVAKGAVLFALPGSPKAVSLALERLILPELGHLVREVSR